MPLQYNGKNTILAKKLTKKCHKTRFTNKQIDNEFYDVCEYIDKTVKSLISSKVD